METAASQPQPQQAGERYPVPQWPPSASETEGRYGASQSSPASDLSPAAQALEKLQTEFREIEAAYRKAIEKPADDWEEGEWERVRAEMDPRKIMPAKYLAFEEKHRGTHHGLLALTQVATMESYNFDPTSNAGKGRVEATDRLIKHYLDQGLSRKGDILLFWDGREGGATTPPHS